MTPPVVLCVVAGLAAWIAVALTAAHIIGRIVAQRDQQKPRPTTATEQEEEPTP